MLSIINISKFYGIEPILKNISFNLNSGERLALVGPNGCGKTTLLRILAGDETPDTGKVRHTDPGLRLGYLPQGFSFDSEATVGSFLTKENENIDRLAREVESLAEKLVSSPNQAELQKAYDRTLQRLSFANDLAVRKPAVLAALGLEGISQETPAAQLSGGQKTRLALAGMLLSDPNILLLDEPTNHLDLQMLEWLEGWLVSFHGAVLFVSHDRTFLNQTATGILELDPLTHTLQQYPGNYTDYLKAKLVERERQMDAYQDQQEEIARLRQTVNHLAGLAVMKRGGKADSGDKFAKGFFSNRSRRTVGRAKHIESRLERLLNEERVEKPINNWQMKMEFGETPGSGREVLAMEDLWIGYGELVLLSGINLHLRYGARAVMIGPNGSGKTTLLRMIAGILPAFRGKMRLGAGVRLGYMRQEQEELDAEANALTTLRSLVPLSETEARAFLHKYLFSGDEVFTPTGLLSYGERARLSLACLVAQGCNFLLLDEPVNHLDIASRARFEQALENFQGTILAVVHDRYFIESLASEIWEIRDGIIECYPVVVDIE
jgi:ATP-binding cassette, subfamily F, member 3